MTCMMQNTKPDTDPVQPATITLQPCPLLADGCAITGKEWCPDDQSIIDNCYRC